MSEDLRPASERIASYQSGDPPPHEVPVKGRKLRQDFMTMASSASREALMAEFLDTIREDYEYRKYPSGAAASGVQLRYSMLVTIIRERIDRGEFTLEDVQICMGDEWDTVSHSFID